MKLSTYHQVIGALVCAGRQDLAKQIRASVFDSYDEVSPQQKSMLKAVEAEIKAGLGDFDSAKAIWEKITSRGFRLVSDSKRLRGTINIYVVFGKENLKQVKAKIQWWGTRVRTVRGIQCESLQEVRIKSKRLKDAILKVLTAVYGPKVQI